MSQAAGGAPAGSVKVTTTPAATTATSSSSSAAAAPAATADSSAQTAAPVTAVANQNGGQAGDQSSGQDANANSNPGGSAPPAPPVSAAPSGSGQTASASWAPASTPQTDSASASSGTPAPVALGLLGDPSLVQQVPITAQGAGSAPTVAVLPPGMDNKTLALDPAAGGNTALTGDVASAATAAASQGVVQTEGPSAANTAASPTGFSQSLAAAANPSEQVKVQLTKGLKDGSDTINVLLHPEDLGTVEVKLQMQDGQVKATISADNPDTLALLKNDSHQLTQQLQNAGFNTDSNSLNFQLRGEGQQGGAFAQQQGQDNGQSSNSGSSNSPYTTDSEVDEQVLAATANGAAANGGLDISV